MRLLSAPYFTHGNVRRAIKRLLNADFPGRDVLATQLVGLKARSIDLEGSLALMPAENAAAASVVRRIPVEAELPDSDGMTIHVLLHVLDGLLNELEIYREDSGSIQRQISPEALNLIVL